MRISDWSSDVCSSDLPKSYASSSGTSSPRGLVSGATKTTPCAAQAARYSPFSVTLAWVQVSPDRYQSTGNRAPSSCAGTNTAKVMSVPVAVERSEEHTSELQSLMRSSYAVFCLKQQTSVTNATTRARLPL